MNAFEGLAMAQLSVLVHAGVPARGVRLTVRELMVAQLERGPLGAREVSAAMEAMVRAACRLVREQGAPDELVELVCHAALDAVRGHGGQSARWLHDAAATADVVLAEMAGGR
jgi:hypothetical protein